MRDGSPMAKEQENDNIIQVFLTNAGCYSYHMLYQSINTPPIDFKFYGKEEKDII